MTYDGTIRINTNINTDGIAKGMSEIRQVVLRGMSASKPMQNTENELKLLGDSFSDTAKKASELQTQMISQKDVQIPTKEYSELQKEFDSLQKKLISVYDSQERFLATGGKEESSTYKKMIYDADTLERKLQSVERSMESLVESGRAFTLGKDSDAEYMERAKENIERVLDRVEERRRKEAETPAELLKPKVERRPVGSTGYNEDAIKFIDEYAAKADKASKNVKSEAAEEERLAKIRENAVVSNKKIVEAMERRKQLLSEIKDLEKAGVTKGYADYESSQKELAQINQKIKEYGKGTESASMASKKLAGAARNAFSGISKHIKNSSRAMASFAASSIKKAVSSMFRLEKSTKKTNNTLEKGFKAILKYGLGIRSFYILVNRFRTAVKEGFKNLAQFSEGTNAALSMLKSSLTQLKNSLATAFNPILTAAAPALTSLINMVSRAATYVGMLFAALTGKGTFTKAKEVQEDYAAGLKDSADAAKDAEKATNGYLSGLDEVKKYDDGSGYASKDSGGYKAPTPGEMFEEVDIPSQIGDFAEKVRDIFSGIWDVFKQAWENKGSAVVDSAKAAFESLKSVAKTVGTTFYEVFTGGIGLTWAESGLELMRSMLDVIRSISDAFKKAWGSGSGLEIVTSIFNMLTQINGLLTSIGDSFSRVFSSGIGTEIWENILGIVTGIYNTVGNLAGKIQEAWDAAGLGDSIWAGILNIFNTILGTLHNITDSTAEWSSKLDFTPLLTSIDGLLKSLEPLAENIGAGLEWFWNNVLLPIAGWTIQEAVPAFLDMISASIDALNEVIEALKPLGIWLWENFLQPLGQWAGDMVISALESITGLLKKFGDWVSKHQEAVQNMTIIIGSFFAAFAITKTITGISNLIISMGGLIGIVQKMGGLIGSVFNPWTIAIGAIIAVGVLLYKNWDTIKAKAKEVWDFVKKKFDEFRKWVGSIFTTDWTKAFGIFGNSLNAFLKNVSNIWDAIKKVFSGVITFISGVFSGDWKKVWEGIKEIFGGIWDGLVAIVKSPINAIIGVLNGLIEGMSRAVNGIADMLNSLRIDIPDWVPGIGGGTLGFNLPKWNPGKIPYLATGAVIPPNREFLAVLGDQKHGRNIEAPEGLMRDIVREETRNELMGMLNQIGGSPSGGHVIHNVVQINRRTLVDEVIKEGRLRQTVTGRNPFELT